MKRKLISWLWKNHRDYLLDKKGFTNNVIHQDEAFLDVFIDVYESRRAELGIRELYNIYTLVKKTGSLDGDVAEVGVYKGGSAKIICEAKGDKRLYLFDTFEGIPDVHDTIDLHHKGDFSETSIEDVKAYLSRYDNVSYHKAVFPEGAERHCEESPCFSFVHLDVDICQSTLDGLSFFYPRLTKGGMLISHDFRSLSCPGVKKAFDEFFADKPEQYIELWDTQCLVVKA